MLLVAEVIEAQSERKGRNSAERIREIQSVDLAALLGPVPVPVLGPGPVLQHHPQLVVDPGLVLDLNVLLGTLVHSAVEVELAAFGDLGVDRGSASHHEDVVFVAVFVLEQGLWLVEGF